MTTSKRIPLTWIGYLCWAVFVNACNVWLITPLVQDYGILGVVAVVLIAALWLLGLPVSRRRRFVTFTLFSLLVGQGASSLGMSDSLSQHIALEVVLCIALVVLAWLYGRVRPVRLIASAIVLVVLNILVPFSQWPFFTHFWIANNGTLTDTNNKFSALPFATVETRSGQAVFTLQDMHESPQDFLSTAVNAVQSSTSLGDLLTSYGHRYKVVELTKSGGKVVLTKPSVQDLARLNPTALNPMFPYSEAHWSVEHGTIIQYFSPVLDPTQQSAVGLDTAALVNQAMQTAAHTEQAERDNWNQVLTQLGAAPIQPSLQIHAGVLSGTVSGRSIHVAVNGNLVVGRGAFTAAGTNQLLVEGVNSLQVVSLSGSGSVVSTYHGQASAPLSSDLLIGAVDTSGRDAVFINASPARILQAQANGSWTQLYEAPNPSLRFEASIRFPGDSEPEIITDDPSLMQSSATRYFTSYTYRSGNLIRNWRVYRTNVVNVEPIRFSNTGPIYVLAGVSGTGQFILLRRHQLPVVPAASTLLLLIILAGWLWRFRERTQSKKGGDSLA